MPKETDVLCATETQQALRHFQQKNSLCYTPAILKTCLPLSWNAYSFPLLPFLPEEKSGIGQASHLPGLNHYFQQLATNASYKVQDSSLGDPCPEKQWLQRLRGTQKWLKQVDLRSPFQLTVATNL